jgi:inner membrane protein
LISVTFVLWTFTQIALGIAIAEVCAGKNLKTKQFYIWFLGTIPDLDVVVGLFRSCKCSPDSPRHQSFALCFIFIPLLGWIISKLKKRLTSFRFYMVLLSVYPCIT